METITVLLMSLVTAAEAVSAESVLAEPVATRFHQVHPIPRDGMERTPGRARAVLLLHGIRPYPLNKGKVHEAVFHDWQAAGSTLVKALGKDADVYAYAYAQNARLESIAEAPGLAAAVGKLRFMGYADIVLVGHSAGGVLARLFVEDHPRSGATKVVQVCAPNDGSSLAKLNITVTRDQEVFLHSLTKKERLIRNTQREDRRIPDGVQFVCVVGTAPGPGSTSDGVVSCKSQWSGDLQKQGIPAVRLTTTHLTVMRVPQTVEKIADIVRETQPRWPQDKVQLARKSIVGQ